MSKDNSFDSFLREAGITDFPSTESNDTKADKEPVLSESKPAFANIESDYADNEPVFSNIESLFADNDADPSCSEPVFREFRQSKPRKSSAHHSEHHHSEHGHSHHHSNHHSSSHHHSAHGHSHHEHSHGEECACGHNHTVTTVNTKYILLAAVAAFVIGLIFKATHLPVAVNAVFFVISTVLAGAPVFVEGVKKAIKGEVDETVLMTIAIIAATFIGEFAEAAGVALFFRLGEKMEEFASNRSRESIRALSEIKSETANVLMMSDDVEVVDSQDVEIGTKIIIYPHERVPLDCVVIKGESTVDASAITGESLPVPAVKGTQLLSGSVNGNDSIVAKTTNTLEESAASRIIKMVEEASSKKSKSQKAISKIAEYYTPAVMLVALLVALIPSLVTHNWAVWTHRALVLLVISCPCALVLSVPLGFFTSIGAAARKGILIKGSRFIEDAAEAACVAFDKTGTLTNGELSIESVSSPVGLEPEAVLLLASIAEHKSTHPIAMAIKAAAPEAPDNLISDIHETPGYGASAVFCGKTILCGGKKMFDDRGIDTGNKDGIFVAINNRLAGVIKISTEIRNDAGSMIDKLRSSGINKIVMLTGDAYDAARDTAYALNVDEFYSDMLPGDKLDKIEELQHQYGKVIYVGDGINDAPVLAASDVGVGMGLGSPAALESADIVLTNSNISKLADTRELAQRTMKIFKINVAFILAVKVIVMLLGIIGIAPMWLAVFSDVGVCFISVIISSLIAPNDIKSVFTSLISSVKNAFEKH